MIVVGMVQLLNIIRVHPKQPSFFLGDHEGVDTVVDKLVVLGGFTSYHTEAIAVNCYRASEFFCLHHDFMLEDQLFETGSEFYGC